MSSAGCSADEDLRHRRRLDRLAGQVRLDVFPVILRRQLLEAVGQRARPATTGPSRRSPSATCRCSEGSSVLVGTCWNRSQFVLTANFRSFSLIGLQIGSPSRFTITAGVLLKKIVGGSALMPFDVLRHDAALVHVGEHAIERDHPLVVWNRLVDRRRRSRAPVPSAASGSWLRTIFICWKLTSRSVTDTLVSASSLIVPSAGLSPALCGGDTALNATRCVCLSQLRSAADRRGCCRRSAGRRCAASRHRLASAWRRRPGRWGLRGGRVGALSPVAGRCLRRRWSLPGCDEQEVRRWFTMMPSAAIMAAARRVRLLRFIARASFLEGRVPSAISYLAGTPITTPTMCRFASWRPR